jgi:MoxR-like ATPase
MSPVDKLKAVVDYIKSAFVGKAEIADLLAIGLVARENAFLLGPPGTAKSAIVRLLSQCIEGGKNFEYLLTRFTEPAEIFGPFDIRKLKEGELLTNTEGMLPEASLIFLDELFNANSAILNSLLTALNEKVFRRGKETRKLPALMFVSASNVLPEDDTLAALLDRFLIRVKCDYVDPDLLQEVLLSGRSLEKKVNAPGRPCISPAELIRLQEESLKIDLSPVLDQYVDIVHNLRSTGINVSDRRAVKLQNLIAASALICGRSSAAPSDFWVLKHIWDTEEQIEVLAGIISHLIEKDTTPAAHPQARTSSAPDPEELAKDVASLKQRWEQEELSFEHQNVIKDKLRYIQSRADWIRNGEQRQYIQQEIETLWQKILQTV